MLGRVQCRRPHVIDPLKRASKRNWLAQDIDAAENDLVS
jgi:hypothetical protein